MRYIDIGSLNKPVSAIGLGTSTAAFSPENSDNAADLLEAFLDAGGNCIDTAHIYGFGNSEKMLGRWFAESGRRDEVVLITKGCHPVVDPDDPLRKPWLPRVTPEAINSDLGESLDRLQTDHVELYLLHRDDESQAVGPLMETLNEEQERGRILTFGASNWSVDRIEQANRYATEHGLNGFTVSSPGLSLARPTRMFFPGALFADDEIRRWHRTHQFPMLAWGALASGFVSGRSSIDDSNVDDVARVYFSEENGDRIRRADELSTRHDVTILQIALGFVLGQPFPVSALIGPSTRGHLDEALGALDLELSADEIRYLDLGES